MSASRPPRSDRSVHKPSFSRAVMMRVSVEEEVGSAFWRMVPVRMKGSWGTAMSRERIVSRGMRERSRSSIVRVPESISIIRRRAESRELLPLV